MRLSGMVLCLAALWANPALATGFDVRAYGAKGDGATKDTAAIQAAIDAAAQNGGGEVRVPAGRYISGTLHLKSHVALYLEPGSVIAQSPDGADFDHYEKLPYDTHADVETSFFHFALVAADGANDIAVLGQGELDGARKQRGGPKPIAFKNCSHVAVRGITVRNAPNYSISFLGCEDVAVQGVTIRNALADGIDPDCCRFVRISDCSIESKDDAICLKTSPALGSPHPTEHVAITNCVLSSSNNAFKLGTESSGDFKDIVFSNCAIYRHALGSDSAIAIESVDGSHIDGVTVSNVSAHNITNAIFIRLGNRGRALNPPVPGSLANVSISNVVATNATSTVSITGVPGAPVRHVSLDNIQIIMQGGITLLSTLAVPEQENKYPEHEMFGPLPAYGIYCRHVEELTLRNVRVSTAKPDKRPALLADDVRGLVVSDFQALTSPAENPVAWLNDVSDAQFSGVRLAAPAKTFLRLTGKASRDIRLFASDLSKASRPVEFGPAVPKSAVRIVACVLR